MPSLSTSLGIVQGLGFTSFKVTISKNFLPYKSYGFVNEALGEFHFRFKGLSGVECSSKSFKFHSRSLLAREVFKG